MIPVERILASDPPAVTLDLDDTLIQYRRSPAELLAVAFERVGCGRLFSAQQYRDRFEEFADQTDSMAELRRACFGTLAAEAGAAPAVGHDVARVYSDERDQTNVELLSGVATLLDRLADRDVPRPVVTNGTPDAQRTKLEAVGLTDRVGPVVFAGHDCPPKPDPEPFAHALRAVGIDPASDRARRVVHVGDSDDDADGAAAANLRFVRVPAE